MTKVVVKILIFYFSGPSRPILQFLKIHRILLSVVYSPRAIFCVFPSFLTICYSDLCNLASSLQSSMVKSLEIHKKWKKSLFYTILAILLSIFHSFTRILTISIGSTHFIRYRPTVGLFSCFIWLILTVIIIITLLITNS